MTTGYNPYYKGDKDAQFKPIDVEFKPTAKQKFKNALKATGKGIAKGAKVTGKVAEKTFSGTVKVGEAVGKGTAATYSGIGRANQIHRDRVIAREQYKTKKLEGKVIRHQLREQLPKDKKYGGHPLSDKGLFSTQKPRKFFTKPTKSLVKSRGGPLSDKNFKVSLNKPRKKGGFFS